MTTSNKEKYIKYKTKQELLNRERIDLVLDENIIKTIKQYMKKHSRAMFEYQLKCYFLQKPLINTLNTNYQANQIIPNINLLIDELQQEMKEIHKTTQIVKERIEIILSKQNYLEKNEDNINSIELDPINNSNKTLNQSQNPH